MHYAYTLYLYNCLDRGIEVEMSRRQKLVAIIHGLSLQVSTCCYSQNF